MVTRSQCLASHGVLCPSAGSQGSVLGPSCQLPSSRGAGRRLPSPGSKHCHHHHRHQSHDAPSVGREISLLQTRQLHTGPTARCSSTFQSGLPSPAAMTPSAGSLWEVLFLFGDPGGFSDGSFFHIPCQLGQEKSWGLPSWEKSWGLPQNMPKSEQSSPPLRPPHCPLPIELEQ